LFISERVTFRPFKSSKVIDFGANRKRVPGMRLPVSP